ncbi:MAG: hypothetical protein V4598_18465 [Bdellovibrionota bacterium]
MKKFIALGLLLGSLSASAQSYLVLNNGILLTTDKAGFLYDFGHFVIPYEVKINGGQFLVEKKTLMTIDENGYKYDKDEKIEKIKGKGNNYVLNDKNELITVGANGYYFKYDKDDALKRVEKFGGNFFVGKDEKKKNSLLYTLNSTGNYFNIALPELNPAEISVLGGTYFMTTRGVYFTIDAKGFVYPKADVKAGAPRKIGGNFVIDNMGKLFTVSESGIFANPVLPTTLNIANISKVGANYMLDNDGKLFVVDKNGNVFERSVNSHDLRNVKVLSL